MVVKNNTTISGDKMKQLLTFSAKRSIYKRLIMSAVVIIFGFGVFLYSILEHIGQVSMSILIFAALFMAIGIAYLIMSLLQFKSLPKKLYKENQLLCDNGCNYTYTFKENSMRCVNNVNGQVTKFDYDYTNLKAIYEYKDRYELRFADDMVAYVFKNGFSEPKMEEFFVSNVSINHSVKEDSKKRIRIKIKKKYKEEVKKSEN